MTIPEAVFLAICSDGYRFTASRLLKDRDAHFRCRDSRADFLRLPQGSPIVHSFCTRGKCFSVAGRNIVTESVCSANGQFSRVNCWGKLETRASANRLPGHCGLSTVCSLSGLGRWPTQGLQRNDSANHIPGIMLCGQYW